MNEIEMAIYDECIKMILKDFSPEESEELAHFYAEYLIRNYHESIENNPDKSMIKKMIIGMEIAKWQDKNKKEKQVSLLPDSALDIIGKLSEKAYDLANLKLMGKVDEATLNKEEIIEYINIMKKSLNEVRDFNHDIARQYFEEGITDFNYAIGQSPRRSFRFHE